MGVVLGELTPVRVSESRTRVRRLIRGWGLAVRSRGAGTRGGRDQWREDGEEGGSVVAESGTGGALQQSPPVTTASHTTHGDQGPVTHYRWDLLTLSHSLQLWSVILSHQSRDHELYDHCRNIDDYVGSVGIFI